MAKIAGLRLMLADYLSHAMSPAMAVDVINAAVLPCLTWASQVAYPTEAALRAWDATIQDALNKYLDLRHFNGRDSDFRHLPRADSGLGRWRKWGTSMGRPYPRRS